jgi:hypothetical protein
MKRLILVLSVFLVAGVCFGQNAFKYTVTTDTLTVSGYAKLHFITVLDTSSTDTVLIYATNAATAAFKVGQLIPREAGTYWFEITSPTGLYIRRIGTGSDLIYVYE